MSRLELIKQFFSNGNTLLKDEIVFFKNFEITKEEWHKIKKEIGVEINEKEVFKRSGNKAKKS